jgi:holliday junction DNA helicase RuvA
MTNADLVQQLRRHANELAHTGSNLYQVRAFRRAVMAVIAAEREAAEVVAESGCDGLQKEFGIGESVAETIAEFLETGSWQPRTPSHSCR